MFYVYFKYFPSNTLRVIHCIMYLHTVILNKFYIHTGSCFPLEHTLRALVGFFSVVAVFRKTRSFNFPDDVWCIFTLSSSRHNGGGARLCAAFG